MGKEMKKTEQLQVHNKPAVPRLKDVAIGYVSLLFICSAALFVFVQMDMVSMQRLLAFETPLLMVFLVLGCSLGLILFGVWMTYLVPEEYIHESNKEYANQSLCYIFIFMSLAGLFEELLFRGIIQNLLYVVFDEKWVAIIASSALFVAFHFSYFKTPIMLLNIVIPSLLFGSLYGATNNLMVPVIVHVAMNVGVTLLFKYKVIVLKKDK
ncbi:CPBP family intramembrane metalloprotease [Paenibacillus illinoisensis]|nr:CPBP family intramembrane metalloprotease [Paenibacillus illinoisensis]